MEDLVVPEIAASVNSNPTAVISSTPTEDPPPKYTPPPSYTTATGARIAKFLRQSIRRSVRRIANVLGESSSSRQQNEVPTAQVQPPPPDYNAVLVEMNQTSGRVNSQVSINVTELAALAPVARQEELRGLDRRTQELAIASMSSPLTAADVASILRSSFRRSTVRSASNFRGRVLQESNTGSMSAENLVDSAAPIGETSLVMEQLSAEGEPKSGVDNSSSVI